MNASVMVRNVHNVSLMANERTKQPQIIAYCPSKCLSNYEPSYCLNIIFCLFHFENGNNIAVTGLNIVIHPQSTHDATVWSVQLGLDFENISGLYFKHSKIRTTNSSRPCEINVFDSQYVQIHSLFILYGTMYLTATDNTYINNVTAVSCNHCMDMYSTNNTVINNVTIRWGDVGIIISHSTYTRISNTTVENISHDAIIARNTAITTITNSTIHFVRNSAIFLEESTNVTIFSVAVIRASKIEFKFTNYTSVRNTQVYHCGILIWYGISIKISDTNLFDPGDTGILLTLTNVSTIINTTVTDATGYGISFILGSKIKIKDTVVMHGTYGIHISTATNVDIINSSMQQIGAGLVVYMSQMVAFDNVTTMNWTRCGIFMQEASNTAILNTVMGPGLLAQRRDKGIVIVNTSNMTIAKSVFKFINTGFFTIDILRQPAVLDLRNSRNVTFRNCTFQGNNITALKLANTHIQVVDNLNFTGNRAYRGAAMTFIGDSSMTLSETGYVSYTNNSADDTGGAIYIVTKVSYSYNIHYTAFQEYGVDAPTYTKCFLKVEGENVQNRLTFTTNSAGQGGEVLYGGSLGTACVLPSGNIRYCGKCLKDFKNNSLIKPDTISKISSDPTRVCFCDKTGVPDIFTVFYPSTLSIYPGQMIVISAVVLGHNFGTVAGSVFAQFLSSEDTLQLDIGQSIQEVQQHHCNKLNYTIYPHSEEKQIVLALTAVKRDVRDSEYAHDSIESLIQEYKMGVTGQDIQDILDFPIFVDIKLLLCPPGFEFIHSLLKCDCKKHLQLLSDVTCNIQYLTIQRRGLVWVGPLTDDNNTVIDVLTAQNCPLNYCKDETVSITLSRSHTQCNYNHSGVVCGGCQPGLSLVLGSAECLKCSNKYLTLLIPLALAGFMLVFFIKILDLTISKGLINGLIFYANIVKPNQHIFLSQMNTNPLTLFIAWLNLDLGIETCFADGLTAYWKTWLQFVFPFYIWAIAGLIIISARYSTRLARVMGNNSVPVLATLFLLSYAKLLRTIITIMSYTVVETPHGQKTVWSADGNIDYLGPKHAPLFVAAIATLLFLWLPYTLLLFLGQWLRKINHRCVTRSMMKVKPFLDAHYGPLTDKHHYWFGTLLFMRVIILLVSAVVPANNFSVFTLSISITSGALITFKSIGPAVYRKTATSIFEICLFVNLGLLGLAKFYTYAAGGNQAAATYTLIGVAFIQFLVLVSYQICCLLKPILSRCHTHHDDDEAAEGIWRFNTSMELWKMPHRATPYQDAATAL